MGILNNEMAGITRGKRGILYWFPVVFLPLGNIIAVFQKTWEMDWRLWTFTLVGAIAEELFFRRFLLRVIFLHSMKPVLAIILISFLFAGMHLFNLRAGAGISETLVQMIFAFCFSIWAGAVTWKSTWLIPLLAHVLLNATACAENIWATLTVSAVVLADGVMIMMIEQRNAEESV